MSTMSWQPSRKQRRNQGTMHAAYQRDFMPASLSPSQPMPFHGRSILRRDFKAIYDDKLRESMDPARSARLGFKQDQAPAPMNRTEMIGLEHADDDEEGLQNIVPRNIELHVDSKVFVTTTATLLASPEGCWFRHMISSFPNAQEFYVDRSPVRAVVRLDPIRASSCSGCVCMCRVAFAHTTLTLPSPDLCSPLLLTPAAHTSLTPASHTCCSHLSLTPVTHTCRSQRRTSGCI